jgi:thiol-disulfide isomerase/thioredoxin
MGTVRKCALLTFVVLLALSLLTFVGGCGDGAGSGKVTVLSFYTEGNESAKEFKPVLDEAKKKYEGEVVFEDIDMEDPANKGKVDEYHVTMDPTYVIINSEGKVKQTFMGKPHEEMFNSAVAGLIPGDKAPPSSAPAGSATVPQSSAPAPEIPGIPTR